MSALHLTPRPKQRSSSLKKPRRRQLENVELDSMRPRTTSLPTRNDLKRSDIHYLSPNAIGYEHSLQPMRSFITTPKGLVNRGDSVRSRSTNSVMSSCSGSVTELTPQSRSRTSSSVSYGSACSHSPVPPGSPVPPSSPMGCMGVEPEATYRVTVLGCQGVGKSSLTQQFSTSQYMGTTDTPFTLGDETELHMSVLLDGKVTALDFFNPSEHLDLHSVPNTDAYVLVFSIDDRTTFEGATDLLYELRHMDEWAGPTILVANKCDLVRTRDVTTDEAKSVAMTYDCKYIETSVVLNHNVDELLVGVVSQIRLKTTPKLSTSKAVIAEGSCYAKSKNLLNKIFRKDHFSKSCENLYVL